MPVAFLLYRLWKKKKKNIETCDCHFKMWTLYCKIRLEYIDFDRSISKILEQDPSFINFDQLYNIYTCDFEKYFLIRNYFS